MTAALLLALLAPAGAAEPVPPVPGTAGVETSAAQPLLEVRETKQDGGTVEQGTVVRYKFTLANRGQGDLEIRQVRPSCGCTAPRWDKVIAPGKEGVIEAEVNTAAFRGPISKYLFVISNDPARPQLQLTVSAKVTPLVAVKPGVSALLSVNEEPATQEFTLERSGGKPMQILQVVCNYSFMKAEAIPLPGEGRFKVAVTATTDTPPGRSTVPVVVRTDLEKSGTVTLIVTVERGIVTAPTSVYWSLTGGPVQLPVQSTVIMSRQKGAFHITGVTADDPKLETKLETVRDGQEYKLLVSYNGGWDGGVVKKTVTVTTDDPKQPEVKIPVQALLPAFKAPPATAGTTQAAPATPAP